MSRWLPHRKNGRPVEILAELPPEKVGTDLVAIVARMQMSNGAWEVHTFDADGHFRKGGPANDFMDLIPAGAAADV